MRRRNIDRIESDVPIDFEEQQYFIESLQNNELANFKLYRRILKIIFLLQTPFTVYWKSLRKAYPGSCLVSLLSISLTVIYLHFELSELIKSAPRGTTQSIANVLLNPIIYHIINGILCLKLISTIYYGELIWRIFFILPIADLIICLVLSYWHQTSIENIKELKNLTYKYKAS
ncbi:hypothetical protein CAAN1_08S01706 [[Candida] anglica]|uniref:Uncharacterized protein n=1 Tax=[Candida] anglica TaxID=148631 RepID=A0ABP0EAC8_9ASCO